MTQAIEAGANEYIMKPFDREIITSKLAEVGLCEGSMAQT
jgi:two-component system chemotaxis response regulator CheY